MVSMSLILFLLSQYSKLLLINHWQLYWNYNLFIFDSFFFACISCLSVSLLFMFTELNHAIGEFIALMEAMVQWQFFWLAHFMHLMVKFKRPKVLQISSLSHHFHLSCCPFCHHHCFTLVTCQVYSLGIVIFAIYSDSYHFLLPCVVIMLTLVEWIIKDGPEWAALSSGENTWAVSWMRGGLPCCHTKPHSLVSQTH